MRRHFMWVRTLTATVLFLMLAKVNVWADTSSHLLLAVGYRSFLLGAPIFMMFGLSNAMRMALALCVIGCLAAVFSIGPLSMVLLALGMAVSGYIAKFVGAHTSRGAADNKVSLNVGSLISGLLLMSAVPRTPLLVLCVALLAVALLASFRVEWETIGAGGPKSTTTGAPEVSTRTTFRWVPLGGWLLVGAATGIKLTGVFTILPQYLIEKSGALPAWFGFVVILNSVTVILLQHRVLAFLDRTRSSLTLVLSMSAMLLLALPATFGVQTLPAAVIWVLLLTLGECALSRYDRLAKEDGYLLPKEVMVGVGSFITVYFSRTFPSQIYGSGLVGLACLAVGAWAVARPRRSAVELTVSDYRQLMHRV